MRKIIVALCLSLLVANTIAFDDNDCIQVIEGVVEALS